MNKRDTKFIIRIIVLAMTSLSLGLGARIVIESRALADALPPSVIRDLLVFFAPVASLSMIHYTLAVRSFGIRSMQTESLILLFVVCIFLSITAPYYFGSDVQFPAKNCSWWKIIGCSKSERKLNYLTLVPIAIAGMIALFYAIKREGIMRKVQ